MHGRGKQLLNHPQKFASGRDDKVILVAEYFRLHRGERIAVNSIPTLLRLSISTGIPVLRYMVKSPDSQTVPKAIIHEVLVEIYLYITPNSYADDGEYLQPM